MTRLIVERIAALTEILWVMQYEDSENSARKKYTN